jgi:hypothetical protein
LVIELNSVRLIKVDAHQVDVTDLSIMCISPCTWAALDWFAE